MIKKLLILTLLIVDTVLTGAPADGFKLRPIAKHVATQSVSALDLKAVDKIPRATFMAKPHFPEELLKRGIQGRAVMFLIVQSDGSIVDLQSVEATDEQFAESAATAIRQWKYQPAEKDGRSVNCRLILPIEFSVNNR